MLASISIKINYVARIIAVIYFIFVPKLNMFAREGPNCKIARTEEWNSGDIREFEITTQWDGQCVGHSPVKISLGECPNGNLLINVDAPFFNISPKPDGPVGKRFPMLWNYEVVEAFFLNDKNQYLEVELGAHGHYLLLLLNDTGNAVRQTNLPITYTINHIDGEERWTGQAFIPRSYLPPGVTKFNAFAIHGKDETRQYEALYPVKVKTEGMTANFHRLELFESINMKSFLPSYDPTFISSEWAPYINKM